MLGRGDLFITGEGYVYKSPRERLSFVIDTYLEDSIANEEAENKIHSNCFKKSLLKDFKPGETLKGDVADKAAIDMAEKLVDLLKKLGQNVKTGGDPIFS